MRMRAPTGPTPSPNKLPRTTEPSTVTSAALWTCVVVKKLPSWMSQKRIRGNSTSVPLDGRVPVLAGRDDLVARADGGRQVQRVGHPLADGVDVLGLEARQLTIPMLMPPRRKLPARTVIMFRAGTLDQGLDLLLRALAEGQHRDEGSHTDDPRNRHRRARQPHRPLP